MICSQATRAGILQDVSTFIIFSFLFCEHLVVDSICSLCSFDVFSWGAFDNMMRVRISEKKGEKLQHGKQEINQNDSKPTLCIIFSINITYYAMLSSHEIFFLLSYNEFETAAKLAWSVSRFDN